MSIIPATTARFDQLYKDLELTSIRALRKSGRTESLERRTHHNFRGIRNFDGLIASQGLLVVLELSHICFKVLPRVEGHPV